VGGAAQRGTRGGPGTPGYPLLLIGDSSTNNYDKATLPDENFQPTWKQFYEPRKALNLGFSGDTTAQRALAAESWRGVRTASEAVVLLIGTNNTGYANQTVEQTESGIDAVVAALRAEAAGDAHFGSLACCPVLSPRGRRKGTAR